MRPLCVDVYKPQKQPVRRQRFEAWTLSWAGVAQAPAEHLSLIFGARGLISLPNSLMLAGTEREPTKQSLWEQVRHFVNYRCVGKMPPS